ncbi:hypothetical protein LIER_05321 [Lithospermum erythrorhizon]|uniref:Uncharacterized protein n=1 Tax=Lithospermum erythrorhizon TaxID=34254 RepID=A0AAV3P049_LITER
MCMDFTSINKKEAQGLRGRIAALTRFISKAGDRGLPFFKAIKKGKSLNGPRTVSGRSRRKDLLEETMDVAVNRMTKYKQKVAAYYKKRVRSRQFLVGDLALRAMQASTHEKLGKLDFPWDLGVLAVLFVRRIVGPVTYELETLKGCQVPRLWNACHLRKYYV